MRIQENDYSSVVRATYQFSGPKQFDGCLVCLCETERRYAIDVFFESRRAIPWRVHRNKTRSEGTHTCGPEATKVRTLKREATKVRTLKREIQFRFLGSLQ